MCRIGVSGVRVLFVCFFFRSICFAVLLWLYFSALVLSCFNCTNKSLCAAGPLNETDVQDEWNEFY